jgi:hypothetical protein
MWFITKVMDFICRDGYSGMFFYGRRHYRIRPARNINQRSDQ